MDDSPATPRLELSGTRLGHPGARLNSRSTVFPKRLLGQLPGRGWVRLPRLHGRGSAPCCGRVPGGARADNPDCMSSIDSTVLKRGRQTCSRMPRRVPASPSLSGFQAPADSRGDDSRRARLRRQLPRSVSCGDRGSECACKRTQGRSEETRGVSPRAGDEWERAPNPAFGQACEAPSRRRVEMQHHQLRDRPGYQLPRESTLANHFRSGPGTVIRSGWTRPRCGGLPEHARFRRAASGPVRPLWRRTA